MPKSLTQTQIEDFRQRGYIFPLHLLATAEANSYLGRLTALERTNRDKNREDIQRQLLRFKPHLLFTWVNELIRNPRILDAVECLIGPNILVWASAFFVKEPHDPSYVAWHQDSVTYGLQGGDLVTAWVALTEVDTENGAMRFLPGSHRGGLLPHVDTWDKQNFLSRGEQVAIEVEERKAVDVVLAAGEMSLHHIDLLHNSPPNRSAHRRVGYAIRYFPPQMRHVSGSASAMLVRGRDRYGHFELEPPPAQDQAPAARAAHSRAMKLRTAQVFGRKGRKDRIFSAT